MALAAIRDITDRRRDRDELRRAVRRLQAATDVAIAVGGETDLERVLEAIVERGRALVEARALIILLREGDDLIVAATAAVAGGLDPQVAQLRIRAKEASEQVLLGRFTGADLDAKESGRALLAPLLFRGEPLGVVVALDRIGEPGRFDDEDQRMLEAFAASAATGVATARSMAEERLQNTIDAAEQERSRWARELHDETLQALAVLRMRLSSALREEAPEALETAGQAAVEQIDDEIVKLRRLITELRPASLDTIGLEAALQALAEQHQHATSSMEVDCDSSCLAARTRDRPPVLETAVYRLVQEALNNVSKHSMARRAEVTVRSLRGAIEIEVRDDGVGFEPSLVREGFGLVGMRERAALLGGTLDVDSTRGIGHARPGRDPAASPGPTSRGRGLDVDQAALDRVADELGAGRHRQLLLDVRAVGLDGAHAQVELLGDLVVRVAERDQAENLELALREIVRRRRVGLSRQPGARARAAGRCAPRPPSGRP